MKDGTKNIIAACILAFGMIFSVYIYIAAQRYEYGFSENGSKVKKDKWTGVITITDRKTGKEIKDSCQNILSEVKIIKVNDNGTQDNINPDNEAGISAPESSNESPKPVEEEVSGETKAGVTKITMRLSTSKNWNQGA